MTMDNTENLYKTIKLEKEAVKKFPPEIVEIPEYITNNLKHSFFEWQKDAFENFLYYQNTKSKDLKLPSHLMFNMATGTGKTLLMAATILYYYKQGYRHFIFFVNQKNIVDKTENNFIDSTHTKYLFTGKIVIDDKTVNIKKVETFSDKPQEIEIKFTSIQKLYNDIHIEKENQTTLDDLHSKDIVMLADEAHHLNVNTRKGLHLIQELKNNAGKEKIERKGWEDTVIKLILNKNGKTENNKNVLLEFTATIPATEAVARKYQDKIIYQFGLKEFLKAGYTKEINLISSTLEKKERILQALLFQWYRHQIALKNKIPNFKPVILFRSKTIEESKRDYEEFLTIIRDLEEKDFNFLNGIKDRFTESENTYEQGKSRVVDLIKLIENTGLSDVIHFIKSNFTERQCMITNSKTNRNQQEKTDENQEKLLNNLEDKTNHIRAIFTVNRLTEGWDVLNLFDIVRLYEGRDESKDKTGNRKAGSATVSEIQLIGRGVRYFRFAYKDKIKNKRKFDGDLGHELRVLEELYFHSTNNHRYIDELKRELKKEGYIPDNRKIRTFALKKEFQEDNFYKNTKIWYNKQIDNPDRKKKTLQGLNTDSFEPYKARGLELNEQEIDFESEKDLQRLYLRKNGLKTIAQKFKDIEKHIFQKAVNIKANNENSLYRFENIKEELDIKSIEELQTDKLADLDVKMIVNKNMDYDHIDNADKLAAVIKFLDNVFAQLKESITPKIGDKFIADKFEKFFALPKTKTIQKDCESEKIAEELKKKKWYVLDSFYGTSEEKALIDFIKETIGNLKDKYKEVYLLRNEEVYKIYDFEKGRGFQPDFILFLKTNKKEDIGDFRTELYYQVFIEPKGGQFIGDKGTFRSGKEGWKEEFLKQITEKYGFNNIIEAENPHYRLIGLPFFNKDHNNEFSSEYEKLIN